MIDAIIRLKNYIKARRRGQIIAHSWVDTEKTLDTLRTSPVPGVVMLAVLWMTCTVLLTLTFQKQHDVSDWVIGQRVPYTVHAHCDFEYIDTAATEAKKDEARKSATQFFKIDSLRTEEILQRFNSFWEEAARRNNAIRSRRPYVPKTPEMAKIINSCSPDLLAVLAAEHLAGQNYLNARERLVRLTSIGIIRAEDKQARIAGTKVKTIDSHRRMSSSERNIGDMPDSALAGIWVADAMFPDSVKHKSFHDEFAELITSVIGRMGNLDFDAELSKQAGDRLAEQTANVVRSCLKGDKLVSKGEKYKAETREKLISAINAIPKNYGSTTIIQHILWSFILLAGTVFMVIKLFPRIICDARRIAIASIVMIASLLANYWALRFFYYMVREDRINNIELIIDTVPIVLSAVVLTVLVGYRIALCCSFLVVSITAMMILPDRTFELAIRWMATSAVAGLAVCKVKNYRVYFIRIFGITIPLVLALSAGILLWRHSAETFSRETLRAMFGIACLNGFSSAVLALVMVFLLELIFNIDTDMALMGLSDFSHPLLERLKREAPGTMFHSITVATIAEDAAKKIGANPLRAKVGGLFHDIGKLSMPQYFVENNRDSTSEHLKLNPQLSSIIIRDHVKEGLILAREHNLYRWIHSAISTHHGDDLVRYFYNEAQKQRQQSTDVSPVIEQQFRYTGKPPRAKELVIVSLADACEAATRSLTKPTPAKIESLVDDIFLMRYKDGQLRNADLSLSELDTVKCSFIKTLQGIHHGRIAYTPENLNAENTVQVEKP